MQWNYVCEQSGEIQAEHGRVSRGAEYGMNFYEFIETHDGLEDMARRWWAEMSVEVKIGLLRDRKEQLEEELERTAASLEELCKKQ